MPPKFSAKMAAKVQAKLAPRARKLCASHTRSAGKPPADSSHEPDFKDADLLGPYKLSTIKVASMDHCISNVIQLTDIADLKWKVYDDPRSSQTPLCRLPEDPIVTAYGHFVKARILATYRRKPQQMSAAPEPIPLPFFMDQTPRELWVFWFSDDVPEEMADCAAGLQERELQQTETPIINPEVRHMFFNALHTFVSISLQSQGIFRFGRWHTKLYLSDPSDDLGFSVIQPAYHLQFFIAGLTSVCCAVTIQNQPTLLRLTVEHIALYEEFDVILAPWAIKARFVGTGFEEFNIDPMTEFDRWKTFWFPFWDEDEAKEPATWKIPEMVLVRANGIEFAYPSCMIAILHTECPLRLARQHPPPRPSSRDSLDALSETWNEDDDASSSNEVKEEVDDENTTELQPELLNQAGEKLNPRRFERDAEAYQMVQVACQAAHFDKAPRKNARRPLKRKRTKLFIRRIGIAQPCQLTTLSTGIPNRASTAACQISKHRKAQPALPGAPCSKIKELEQAFNQKIEFVEEIEGQLLFTWKELTQVEREKLFELQDDLHKIDLEFDAKADALEVEDPDVERVVSNKFYKANHNRFLKFFSHHFGPVPNGKLPKRSHRLTTRNKRALPQPKAKKKSEDYSQDEINDVVFDLLGGEELENPPEEESDQDDDSDVFARWGYAQSEGEAPPQRTPTAQFAFQALTPCGSRCGSECAEFRGFVDEHVKSCAERKKNAAAARQMPKCRRQHFFRVKEPRTVDSDDEAEREKTGPSPELLSTERWAKLRVNPEDLMPSASTTTSLCEKFKDICLLSGQRQKRKRFGRGVLRVKTLAALNVSDCSMRQKEDFDNPHPVQRPGKEDSSGEELDEVDDAANKSQNAIKWSYNAVVSGYPTDEAMDVDECMMASQVGGTHHSHQQSSAALDFLSPPPSNETDTHGPGSAISGFLRGPPSVPQPDMNNIYPTPPSILMQQTSPQQLLPQTPSNLHSTTSTDLAVDMDSGVLAANGSAKALYTEFPLGREDVTKLATDEYEVSQVIAFVKDCPMTATNSAIRDPPKETKFAGSLTRKNKQRIARVPEYRRSALPKDVRTPYHDWVLRTEKVLAARLTQAAELSRTRPSPPPHHAAMMALHRGPPMPSSLQQALMQPHRPMMPPHPYGLPSFAPPMQQPVQSLHNMVHSPIMYSPAAGMMTPQHAAYRPMTPGSAGPIPMSPMHAGPPTPYQMVPPPYGKPFGPPGTLMGPPSMGPPMMMGHAGPSGMMAPPHQMPPPTPLSHMPHLSQMAGHMQLPPGMAQQHMAAGPPMGPLGHMSQMSQMMGVGQPPMQMPQQNPFFRSSQPSDFMAGYGGQPMAPPHAQHGMVPFGTPGYQPAPSHGHPQYGAPPAMPPPPPPQFAPQFARPYMGSPMHPAAPQALPAPSPALATTEPPCASTPKPPSEAMSPQAFHSFPRTRSDSVSSLCSIEFPPSLPSLALSILLSVGCPCAAAHLQDTILDLHFDATFDSCPLCACNGTIKARELGVYISPAEVLTKTAEQQERCIPPWSGFAVSSQSGEFTACTCGFSAIRYRLFSMGVGLFPDDAREATGDYSSTADVDDGIFEPSSFWPLGSTGARLKDAFAVLDLLRRKALFSEPAALIDLAMATGAANAAALQPETADLDRGEYFIPAFESTELLLVWSAAFSALAPSNVISDPRDDVRYYFHEWGLQIENELTLIAEPRLPTVMSAIAGGLEHAIKKLRRIDAASKARVTEGPLTLAEFAAKCVNFKQAAAAAACTPLPAADDGGSSSSSRSSSKSPSPPPPPLARSVEPVPSIVVGGDRDDGAVCAAPFIVRFWDTFNLGPVDQPKDVAYLGIALGDDHLERSLSYIRELSLMYEAMHLGKHIRVGSSHEFMRSGVMRLHRQNGSFAALGLPCSHHLVVADRQAKASGRPLDDQLLFHLYSFCTQFENLVGGFLRRDHSLIFSREIYRQTATDYFRSLYYLSALSQLDISEALQREQAAENVLNPQKFGSAGFDNLLRGGKIEKAGPKKVSKPVDDEKEEDDGEEKPATLQNDLQDLISNIPEVLPASSNPAPGPSGQPSVALRTPNYTLLNAPSRDDDPELVAQLIQSQQDQVLMPPPRLPYEPPNAYRELPPLLPPVQPQFGPYPGGLPQPLPQAFPLPPEDIADDEPGTLPHVLVLYVVDPFSVGARGTDPRLARLVSEAYMRSFNAVVMRLPLEARVRVQLHVIPASQLFEHTASCPSAGEPLGPDWSSPGSHDAMKALCLAVYSETRLVTSDVVKGILPKSMTMFGPASEMMDHINSTGMHSRLQPIYQIPSAAFHLTPRHLLQRALDSAAPTPAQQPEELVLYVSYCLLGGDFLCVSATDAVGRLRTNTVINIKPYNPTRRALKYRQRSQIIDATRRMWQFIQSCLAQQTQCWRLVVGKLGRIGHAEFKAWTALLSKTNLKRYNQRLKDSCAACQAMPSSCPLTHQQTPVILSACLTSLEPEPFIKILHSDYRRLPKGEKEKTAGKAVGLSITHIIVFPTSADIVLGSPEVEGQDEVDFNIDIGDLVDDELNEMMDIGHEPSGPVSMRANIHGQFSSDGFYENVEIENQPLAVGYYFSSAPAPDLPDWFWATAPSSKNRAPTYLKSSLHINATQVLQDDTNIGVQKPPGEKAEPECAHPLDSTRTDEVLRHVLETYNALSYLEMDHSGERRSCLPTHMQALLRLYHSVARFTS